MDQAEKKRLKTKLTRLSGLQEEIGKYEEILKSARSRAPHWEGADETVMNVFREFFSQLSDLLPEKNIRFHDNNSFDGLLAQLSSVRAKVDDAITDISSTIGIKRPTTNRSRKPANNTVAEPVDKRRVFVVHGRNMKAKEAMFTLLRSFNLDPIEWEEAVHMTNSASPYTGHVLDAAFSNAQAAVISLTGDDLACLGEQFVEPHDPDDDKRLTAQARPNVIFEMGMAFGKYPDRTVIVQFGKTRQFSDVLGRHTIHFRDNPESRKKIGERLKRAGCDVKLEGREGWLKAGDFSSAFDPPLRTELVTFDPNVPDPATGLTPISPDVFRLENDNNELKKRAVLAELALSTAKEQMDGLQQQLAVPKITLSILNFEAFEEKYYVTESVFARMGSPTNCRILIRLNVRISNEHRPPTTIESFGLSVMPAPGGKLERPGVPLRIPEIARQLINFAQPVIVQFDFRIDHTDAQAIVKSYFAIAATDGTGARIESDAKQILRVDPLPPEQENSEATDMPKALLPSDPRLSITVHEDTRVGTFRSGATISLKNVGGSEAQGIELQDITVGAHTVAFPQSLPVLNPGDSTPPFAGRISDYGPLQQHDLAGAMLEAWNDERDIELEHMAFPASATYTDYQGNKFRATWTYEFLPLKCHIKRLRQDKQPADTRPYDPYLSVSTIKTERSL